MIFKGITGIFLCFAIISVSGNGLSLPPEPVTTSSPPPTTSNSTDITTEITSVSPNTTTEATTISPTTTTSSPPTTTAPNTTTSSPPTTVAPNTTTSSPPTTVAPATTTVGPKPTPSPVPKTGKWVVNGTNYTCIIVSMSAQFNLTYLVDNKTTLFKEIIMPSDSNSTNATGQCDSNQQFINLQWKYEKNYTANLGLYFGKNESRYSLNYIVLEVNPQPFVNLTSNFTALKVSLNTTEYQTAVGNSYRCIRLQSIKLDKSNMNNASGIFKVSDLQLEAFRKDKSTVFGLAEDCSFVTPDVVPIVVGCVLMVLIIIVLAAYLIGRRRSQARGYLSM